MTSIDLTPNERSAEFSERIDSLVLGRRVRHLRKRAGLTLQALGERVGHGAPYLSQLERGRVEPRLSLVNQLAAALATTPLELLDPAAPTARAALEIELERLQQSEQAQALGLSRLRVSPRLPDELLAHVVELHRALARASGARAEAPQADASAGAAARRASATLRREMRERGNYLADHERVAARLLRAARYAGHGPVSERVIGAIAQHLGFRIARVPHLPGSTRSVADLRRRIVYIPQRDDLRIRAARTTVLQTLGHFALGHREPADVAAYLRQRVEANYFAGAVLAPEAPAVELLPELERRRDLSIEDLKEAFYLSYEMAAHRFTNLATRHLGLPTHFLRADREGVLGKAYENDGLPLPAGAHGAVEGEHVPRSFGTRRAWDSADPLHYQLTTMPAGGFFCVTYIETESDRAPHAITIGTTARAARRFRGGRGAERVELGADDGVRDDELAERYRGGVWAASSERSHALSLMPTAARPFTPFPGVELDDVYRFLDRLEPHPA